MENVIARLMSDSSIEDDFKILKFFIENGAKVNQIDENYGLNIFQLGLSKGIPTEIT